MIADRKTRPLLTLLVSAGIFVVLLGVVVAIAPVWAGGADADARRAPAHPPTRYWGAQIGDQFTGEQPPWDMRGIYKFERAVHKHISLSSFNAPFVSCEQGRCAFNSFPTTPLENLRHHGVIPVFGWSSSSVSEGTSDPNFRFSKIIHGKYDSYIREFAEAAREWGHPFFLRFDWEMNGNWFPWSEGVNGNRRGEFVAAWRHIHDIFTNVGATNVSWVWCPNVGYEYKYRELYPGNRYVDWACLDGYNWGTRWSWGHWQTFKQVFGRSYRAIRKVAPSKPVMLGEIASSDYGGSKATWINEMFHELRTGYDKVRAMIWFDVNDRGTHWPIETSKSVTKAFSNGVRGKSYAPNVFADLSGNPIPPPH